MRSPPLLLVLSAAAASGAAAFSAARSSVDRGAVIGRFPDRRPTARPPPLRRTKDPPPPSPPVVAEEEGVPPADMPSSDVAPAVLEVDANVDNIEPAPAAMAAVVSQSAAPAHEARVRWPADDVQRAPPVDADVPPKQPTDGQVAVATARPSAWSPGGNASPQSAAAAAPRSTRPPPWSPRRVAPADPPSSSGAEAAEFIRSEISSHDAVIFSMASCPHCLATTELFRRLNVPARIVELDRIPRGLGPDEDSVAVTLWRMYGQRTVPNVFVRGRHVGGNDEVQAAARSGELERMLAA